MSTDKANRQKFARQSSPGFAVSRYVDNSKPKTKGTDVTRSSDSRALRLAKEKPVKIASTELSIVVDKASAKQLSKYGDLADTVKKTASVFGIRKQEIMDAVAAGNTDHAILQFQRQAYSTIVNLIPLAEAAYIRDKRESQAYALNALISQGRELAHDLMASSDRQNLSRAIATEILEPVFKSLLQQILQEQLQLKAILGDKLKPQYISAASFEMDESIKRLAGLMTTLYQSTTEQINKKLLGD
jgi:hypothetical protein